jgi:amino acid permease
MREESNEARTLHKAEARVVQKSAEFRKELGLRDLALTQILFVIGLVWVGTAGKLGPAHVVFWLVAIALFYIPSAIVVIYLNRQMPLEGGLYQWAKLGFNEMIGFMVAWNLWLYVMTNTSETGLLVTTTLSYALGPHGAWIASNKFVITLASAFIVTLLVVISTIGLGLGKWVHNAGGIIMLSIFATLIALPFLNLMHGDLREFHPLATAVPVFSLLSLNILGKLGFGALGGFEYVAILAGECRNPARIIGHSRHQFGAGFCTAGKDRFDRPHSPSVEHRVSAIWTGRHDCADRIGLVEHSPDYASQCKFYGSNKIADGCGMGSLDAAMVHEIASPI